MSFLLNQCRSELQNSSINRFFHLAVAVCALSLFVHVTGKWHKCCCVIKLCKLTALACKTFKSTCIHFMHLGCLVSDCLIFYDRSVTC